MVCTSNLIIKADESEYSDDFYGVVLFDGNVKYTSIYNGETSFDSGFGKDAAFLYIEDDQVYFKVSGDIGYISIDEVEIVAFNELNTRISAYYVKDGILYHNIKTNFDNNYYTYSLAIDDAPDYLENDAMYYSYDGIYFYTSFNEMIDDYREGTCDSSINNNNPYYNYYQFLPVRSYTNIKLEEIEDYFYKTLKIKGKLNSYSDLSKDGANDVVNRSQYYEEFKSFYTYEEIYGTNAMRLLAESINESSFGKSYNSYIKNNVYSFSAYDTNDERENDRYNNIDTSIYSHAKYFLSHAYANNMYDDYKGSFLGNKASGVSASYSSDLFNAEKVASFYYQIDSNIGYKDKNAYTLGVIENLDTLDIFEEENGEVLFSLNNLHNYTVILLEETDEYYKIQVDPSFNEDYMYDPEKSIGYIEKDAIDYLVGSDEIKENKYTSIHYDFGKGELHYLEDVSFKIKEGNEPIMVYPELEGYDAISFSLQEENYYVTDYAEIRKVEIGSKAKEKSEYGEPYNLTGGTLKITYGNFSTKTIEFNTNYLKEVEEDKFVFEYAGFSLKQNINISYGLATNSEEIDEIIKENIDSYKNDGTYNISQLKRVKENIKELGYELSIDEIRTLDEIFLEDSREDVNYSFEKFDYDISVSGLALNMKEPGILKIFKPFKDTYFTRIGDVSSSNKSLANSVAKAYGFKEVSSLKLSIQFNLRTAKLETPIVVSIKIDDKKDNSIYTVYHVDRNGDVSKCLTAQSDDYIRFVTNEDGDYFIYQKDGFNDFDLPNYYENINIYNADADNHLLFINGSMLFAIGIVGAAIIVVHIMLNKRQEKIWKDYKKSWQPVASPQEEKLKN